MLHRLSGVALALFLPVHFYRPGPGPQRTKRLWTGHSVGPKVQRSKSAEFGLVFLLAVHFFGGLRLMAMEWLPWSDNQKTYAAAAAGVAFLVAGSFLLRAI